MTFMFVPSHAGINGKERADSVATKASVVYGKAKKRADILKVGILKAVILKAIISKAIISKVDILKAVLKAGILKADILKADIMHLFFCILNTHVNQSHILFLYSSLLLLISVLWAITVFVAIYFYRIQ